MRPDINMRTLSEIMTLFCIISGFIAIGYSVLKNKQHLLLCEEYRKHFGYLPVVIILSQAGGIFLTFQKDIYFFLPLALKKGNFVIRNMESEHYDFIRNLPHKMTNWLKVKFSLITLTILFLIASFIFHCLSLLSG